MLQELTKEQENVINNSMPNLQNTLLGTRLNKLIKKSNSGEGLLVRTMPLWSGSQQHNQHAYSEIDWTKRLDTPGRIPGLRTDESGDAITVIQAVEVYVTGTPGANKFYVKPSCQIYDDEWNTVIEIFGEPVECVVGGSLMADLYVDIPVQYERSPIEFRVWDLTPSNAGTIDIYSGPCMSELVYLPAST